MTPEQVAMVRHMVGADHGLAVVATTRPDGTVQATVVNAGVLDHPLTRKPVVAFVAMGRSARLRYLRHTPRATVTFRAGWDWVTVEGSASLAGPEDLLSGFDPINVPQLLRDIFLAAGGHHDNWDEYDAVMAEERRTAVMVEMERIYTNS